MFIKYVLVEETSTLSFDEEHLKYRFDLMQHEQQNNQNEA